jgi:Trypsin-like peptidase domain
MLSIRSGIVLGILISLPAGPSFAESRSGTGFAIANGTLLITNSHVIAGCAEVSAPGMGSVKVIKSDPRADIAILKPSLPIEKGLTFRSGHQVQLGEEIIVIGYPLRGVLSSPPTVTTGIVSSLAGMRDDRTRMQISAPVQPGNSGGPVLDRSGNVVGVIVSKLDAVRAAAITGDIPQNVNFAVHASIVTSILDSYSLNYDSKISDAEMSVAKVVSASLSAVVLLECTESTPSARIPAPSAPPTGQPSPMTATVLCGREVSYFLNETATNEVYSKFVGVWTGLWNNASRLCGALVVEKVSPDGTAEVTYIFGPSRPGTAISWKRQHSIGVIRADGKLSFRDDQGSTFVFTMENQRVLTGLFGGATGRLNADFEKLH